MLSGEIDVSPGDVRRRFGTVYNSVVLGPQRVTAGITMASPTARVYHFYSPRHCYRSYDRARIENVERDEGDKRVR